MPMKRKCKPKPKSKSKSKSKSKVEDKEELREEKSEDEEDNLDLKKKKRKIEKTGKAEKKVSKVEKEETNVQLSDETENGHQNADEKNEMKEEIEEEESEKAEEISALPPTSQWPNVLKYTIFEELKAWVDSPHYYVHQDYDPGYPDPDMTQEDELMLLDFLKEAQDAAQERKLLLQESEEMKKSHWRDFWNPSLLKLVESFNLKYTKEVKYAPEMLRIFSDLVTDIVTQLVKLAEKYSNEETVFCLHGTFKASRENLEVDYLECNTCGEPFPIEYGSHRKVPSLFQMCKKKLFDMKYEAGPGSLAYYNSIIWRDCKFALRTLFPDQIWKFTHKEGLQLLFRAFDCLDANLDDVQTISKSNVDLLALRRFVMSLTNKHVETSSLLLIAGHIEYLVWEILDSVGINNSQGILSPSTLWDIIQNDEELERAFRHTIFLNRVWSSSFLVPYTCTELTPSQDSYEKIVADLEAERKESHNSSDCFDECGYCLVEKLKNQGKDGMEEPNEYKSKFFETRCSPIYPLLFNLDRAKAEKVYEHLDRLAIAEIVHEKQQSDLIIHPGIFKLLAEEILLSKEDYKFSADALDALQLAAETILIEIFHLSVTLAKREERTRIFPSDIYLARRMHLTKMV